MRASLVAQLVKNPPATQETPVPFLGRKIRWRKDRLPTPAFLGFPGGSAGGSVLLQCRKPQLGSWVGKICWRRARLPTPVFLGCPGGSAGKESACNVGDLGLFPGLGRSPGKGKGYPLQYSGLENSMDYSPWGCKESDTTA